MNSDPISCRIIRSCLDYASTKNIDLEHLLSKYDYSKEMLEDSYNWVTVDFFNEIIDKISSETGKQETAFEIGSDSTLRNSWGDIENVIKAIANPKPILMNVERFTSYFLKVPALKLADNDNVSVTIKPVDHTGLYNNAVEFILGALISIPRLWGGSDLSAVRFKDESVRINFSPDPCFFDTANDYKKYSPKLLEEIVLGLERTKKIIEHKNKELERKNKELEKAYIELERTMSEKVQNEKMTTLGELSTGIAHEINNPLSFVISNLQSLKKYFNSITQSMEKDGTLPQEIINDIPQLMLETEDGLNRVKKLVEEINFLAHPGSGEKTEADVIDIIRNALQVTLSSYKNVATIEEQYQHKSKVFCTPSKLSQVFMNVILNSVHAIKSKNQNGEKGKIRISTKEHSGIIEISIRDNGIGIKKEDLPFVSTPFFTTKKAGEGTGLGLSTAISILSAHKGRMAFESFYGAGTNVTITLQTSQLEKIEKGLFE
jgi:signal transduction histidine kinase